MKCKCGYDGRVGWMPVDVGQEPDGSYITGWGCPECGEVICENGDCPPDEFGQIPGRPGNWFEEHPFSTLGRRD